MKVLPCIALTALAAAPAAIAQNNNRLERNNQPYYVQSTGTHATTGTNYNWPPVNHPGYSNGSGVPQGAKIWRTYDTHVTVRQEQWRHTGYTMLIKQSAATTNFFYYEPATGFCGVTPRGGTGPGWDPDFNNILGTPTTQMPSAASGAVARLTVTHAPVNIRFDFQGSPNAFAMWADYNGGEEQNLPGDPTTNTYSQGFCGSWQDGPILAYNTGGTTYVPDGFFDQASGITYKTTDQFRWWATPLFDNPTINLYSDYGQRRIAALTTPLPGHSDGSYYGDIASQSFYLGITVNAGATFQTGNAIILMNVQPNPWGFGTPIPNPWTGPAALTVELAPFDPFLTAIAGIPQVLDAQGNVSLDLFGVSGVGPGTTPPIAGLLGLYVGFEAWTLDNATTASDTTDAAHVRVVQ